MMTTKNKNTDMASVVDSYKKELLIVNEVKELFPYQLLHVDSILKIHGFWPVCSDTSKMGQGKTFTTCEVGKREKLKLLIFCTGHVKEIWQQVASSIGVEVIAIYNYNELRGVDRSDSDNILLRHKYLSRTKNVYKVTDDFRTLLKEGILVVFDESHCTRNVKTLTFQASKVLIQEIVTFFKTNSSNNEGRSRAILLSGSPFSELENIGTHLCMLGIIKDEKINVNEIGKPIDYSGLQQIKEWCESFQKDFPNIKIPDGPRSSDINTKAMLLFEKFISNLLVSRMEEPFNFEDKVYNAFFPLDKANRKKYNQTLISEGKLNETNKQMDNKNKENEIDRNEKSDTVQISNQLLKCPGVIAFTRSILDKRKNSKVCIFTAFTQVQNFIYKDLSKDYGTFILNGKTPKDKRSALINSFQAPNLKIRVNICNPTVGGNGISLDDQDGNFHHYFINFLTFDFITTYQTIGRGNRRLTKSQPYYYNFLFDNTLDELRITRAIHSKNKITTKSTRSKSDIYEAEDIYFSEWDIDSDTREMIFHNKHELIDQTSESSEEEEDSYY